MRPIRCQWPVASRQWGRIAVTTPTGHVAIPYWPARSAFPGFTLVELLIVIAIIALLIGTLVPALGRSRASAQQAACASNIRQLVLAVTLYAHDNDDLAPPGAPEFQTRNLRRWHGSRASISEPFTSAGAPITAYLDDNAAASAALRACPTFTPMLDALNTAHTGFERSCGGYGYNNAFLGQDRIHKPSGAWIVRTDKAGARLSRFAAPANSVAFADTAFAAETLIEYSFIEPPFWPQFPGARPDPSTHFRHANHAAVAWLDAHVTAEPLSHTGSSGLYTALPADFAIGWFGPDDNSRFDYE